jgi:hypothetical protein
MSKSSFAKNLRQNRKENHLAISRAEFQITLKQEAEKKKKDALSNS